MRKQGKVKIVLTVFIIVLFSCTAVIGNSMGGCPPYIAAVLPPVVWYFSASSVV